MKPIDCKETCPHLQIVAEAAVKKVFYVLGVDIDDPKEVEGFRADLRFNSLLRKITRHGILALSGVLVTMVVTRIFG